MWPRSSSAEIACAAVVTAGDEAVESAVATSLAACEHAAREDGGRLTRHPRVRPLRRGERPDLAGRVDQVAAEGDEPPVDPDEVRDRAHRVAGRRQRVDLEPAVVAPAVLVDGSREPDGRERREPRLAEVVVVLGPASRPVLVGAREQVAFRGRRPHARSVVDRTLQPLDAVAVMVGHQHVRDPLDAERVQAVEHGPAAEVEADRADTRPDDPDVAGVVDPHHVRR